MLDGVTMATAGGLSHSISSSSSNGSPAALFATDIVDNVIDVKNVILNEFHVLRKFLLLSTCDQALRVSLDSDLGSQIGFQLNNENIDNADESSGAEAKVATFLADDFCQLYNAVNLVNEVILQPRQIQQVIITFRPSEASNDGLSNARKVKDDQRNAQSSSEQKIYENGSMEPSSKNDYPRANETFKVNGRLFLSATIFSDEAQAGMGSGDEAKMDHCQDVVVHFYSTICCCILKVDVTDIVFDDCVPGGVFVKDLSVWNLSEIPCAFQIHVKKGQCEQPALDLTDYDTELPVASGEIKSCAHRRIRVIFKPRDVGEFSYTLHLENSFDSRNSTFIPVHCIVNTEHRQEGLLVTGVGEDGVLDFGDCYSTCGSCQMLTIRNITHEALVVNLSTDHSPGDQVNFYLPMDLDITSASNNGFMPFGTPPEGVSLGTGDENASSPELSHKLGDSVGSAVNFDKESRIEVLSLERGEEKNLLVWFYAARALDEVKAVRLQRRTFRLSLKCAEKKGRSKQRFSNIIQCKARVCTSIVKLSTPELNFGDCNIGSTKSATFEILNLSDLPALVTSCVTSTILSFKAKAEKVPIPPRQSYRLDVDLVPLKINLKYRKQITIDNSFNKDNQQILEVRGKIMDRHHVLLHSLYYHLRTPSMNNFLNFDCVIVNNPSVRTLVVENITDQSLTLGFNTSMPGELGIYQLRDASQSEVGDDIDSIFSEDSEEDDHESRMRAYAASVNKAKLLETLEESQPRLSKAIVDSAPFPVKQDQRKAIPPRPPFTAAEKKTRMRMSLDLATTSFVSGACDKASGLVSSPTGSGTGDDEVKKELMGDGKPFAVTTEEHTPRPLKRVQSSAMLSAIEEEPHVVAESSHEKVSPEGIEEVLKRLGNHIISQCFFSDEEAEKQYVDRQIKDRELLMHVLEDLARTLTPVRKLELLPGETKILYVLLTVDAQTRPTLQGKLQKLKAKVHIQLLDCDRERQQLLEGGSMEQPVDEDLSRELPVHFKACRALLSLAQKNISFGKMLTNEHRAKTLVLNNISDVPLLYKLKKTGSIASGDLHIINGRCGILRPHSDREINFVFQPSLGGSFHETLVVGNVYDNSNDQLVTLKAFISRADTFWLNTSSIGFGTVAVGEWSKPQSIVIVNNSKQSRTYTLKAADYVFDDKATKSMLDGSLTVLRFMLEQKRKLSPESAIAPEEEAVEALERKGIAFERKGKADKAAKIRKQVHELRERLQSSNPKNIDKISVESSGLEKTSMIKETDRHPSQGEGPVNGPDIDEPADGHIFKPKWSDGYISLTLKGGDSKTVFVRILVSLSSAACLEQRIAGTLVVYESKNQDAVKKVYYEGSICRQVSLEDGAGAGAMIADSLNLTLRTNPRESLHYPASTQSQSISPESSAPTSPFTYTPYSATAQNPFRSSSPGISSTFSPFDESIIVDTEVIGSSSASSNLATTSNSGTSFSQVVGTGGWGSKQHILEWGKEGEGLASDDVSEGVANDDESSRSECGSGPFGFDQLFKIDLLQPQEQTSMVERGNVDDDHGMDLSSATALARSLVSQRVQEQGKAFSSGELILDDSSNGDERRAAFLIKSESPQDIWIQFYLTWEGQPNVIELWVGTLGGAADLNSDARNSVDLSTRHKSRQLRWEEQERSEYLRADSSIRATSMFLKGGTVSMVTLIFPDQPVLKHSLVSDVGGSVGNSITYDRKVQATGVLTMQARPDDGLTQQLRIQLKHLDKCIKVSPSSIIFPDSELTTVLRQDFIVKNRTGTTLTYKTWVTEPVSNSTAVSPTHTTERALVASDTTPDLFVEAPSEVSNDSVVSMHPSSGHLEGHSSVSIKVSCRPSKPGKKSYILHLQTSLCLRDTQVRITMTPIRANYLHLPDLPDGVSLDMGSCFINAPSRHKVVPLRLQNLASELLVLSFRSNLTKQVYISTTSDGLKRTDDLQLAAGALATVFMCLRPGGDAAAFDGGQCREVVGGMKILVRVIVGGIGVPHREKVVDEITVKFRAIVGRSLLQVSASLIDLGRVKEVGGFVVGDFLVSNPSSQLPLRFRLTTKKAELSVSEGCLAGKDAARLNGGPAQSDMAVKFSLPVSGYGLIEDQIVVQNLSCAGQNAELVLRLFVDGGGIESRAESPLRQVETEHKTEASSLPISGSKSDFLCSSSGNRFESHQEVALALSDPEERSALAKDRMIRKASSAGDFFFAGLTPFLVSKCQPLQQGGEVFGPSLIHEATPFLLNSCLDLGTVFVSPYSRRNNLRDPPVRAGFVDSPSYAISDFRPYHGSLLISNRLKEPLELQPFSNLQMLVAPERKDGAASQKQMRNGKSGNVCEDMPLKSIPDFGSSNHSYLEESCRLISNDTGFKDLTNEIAGELVTKLVNCGQPFVIQPFCTTRLFVNYLELQRLSSSELGRLSVGSTSTIDGLLVLFKRKSGSSQSNPNTVAQRCDEIDDSRGIQACQEAVEVFNITGSICISVGNLVKKYVDLGKVGYANRWANVEFDITVENTSDAVLVFHLVDVPDCFVVHLDEVRTEVKGEERGYVAPRSSSTLRVDLCTAKLEHMKQAGPCSWHIRLLNCNNPNNLMELIVEAEMTVRTLRFGGLTEGALLLPSLTLPSLPSSSPCTMHFVVENLSPEPLGVALQLQQAEETESLVMLEVVSPTNTSTGELTLKPGEKVDLRVFARPISDTIPSHFLADHVLSRRTSRIGSGDSLNIKDANYVLPDVLNGIVSNAPPSSIERVHAEDVEHPEIRGMRRNSQGSSELARTVCFGQLYLFSSPHLPDCIPIHGALLRGSSFDVSPHNLHLQAKMAEVGSSGGTWIERHAAVGSSQIVVVRNFRAFESLQFSVFSNENEKLATGESPFAYVSVQPLEGSIPPRGSAEIVVHSRPWSKNAHESLTTSVDLESLTIALSVRDVEAHESERNVQRIVVNIRKLVDTQEPVLEGSMTPTKLLSRKLTLDENGSHDGLVSGQPYKKGPLVLGLRGCTPVGGNLLCYEFNLGQQNISSGGRRNWELTLVGDQNRPINYRLSTIGEGYKSWLTISSSHGVVEAAQQKIVKLSFSTKAMGVYSTYLVVENLENPADFKTVHLSLEVVAPKNVRPEAPSLTFFHVLVNGDRAEGTVIDMGEVFYNFWYRNRSFVVVNDAPVAMEFLLSSSVDKNELTELNFSLDNTSLKRFSSVTLGAKSSVRLWIHFCPNPWKGNPISEDTDIMSANIFVNCRLVKDYRQCIPFRAKCRYPQIGISTTDLVFSTRRESQSFSSDWINDGSNALHGDNDSENVPVNAPLIESEAVVGSTGTPVQLETCTGQGESNGGRLGQRLKAVLPATSVLNTPRDDDIELLPSQQVLVIRNLFANRMLQYVVKNDSLFFTTDVTQSQIDASSQSLQSSQMAADSCSSAQPSHDILVRPNMESLLAHQKTILKQKYVEEHLTVYNRSNPREKYTVSLRVTAGHLRNFFAAPGPKNSYPFNRLELMITGFLSAFYSLASHILAGLAPLHPGSSRDLENWLEACVSGGHCSPEYDSLFFDFHYLTDELVFYCLKERWSRGGATLELATVQLARLLYCALYRCQIFQVCVDTLEKSSPDVFETSSSSPAPEHRIDDEPEVANGPYSNFVYSSNPNSDWFETPLTSPAVPSQCFKFLESWTGQLRHFLSFFPDSRDDLIPLRELSQKNQDSLLACKANFT